ALVCYWLRYRSAQLRYLIGCLCLLAMATAPILTYASLAQRHSQNEASLAAASPDRPVFIARGDLGQILSYQKSGAISSLKTKPSRSFSNESILPWLVAFWLAGVLFLSGRLFIGWISVQRLKRQGISEIDPAWLQKISELKQRAGISRAVRIFRSALI